MLLSYSVLMIEKLHVGSVQHLAKNVAGILFRNARLLIKVKVKFTL
jgi:hypothetical protein